MGEKRLSKAGRQEVALALLLLKDFKCGGRFDTEIAIAVLDLADYLHVREEYDELMVKLPPMKIEPR